MKKMYSLLISVCLLTCISTMAQNTSPYWSTTGNSNATTLSKLGTINNIPLRILTNNLERMRIDVSGKIGIGTTAPKGQLTIQSSGSAPASSWVSSGVPIFAGFGENTPGNADDILAMASNTASARAVFLGRKSRGTLAAPKAVQLNDYLLSLYSSGYDGGSFQAPASVDFLVDGSVSSGHVPARISLSTGSGFADRTERLTVGSTGDINVNNGQLFVQQSTGNVGIGTTAPTYNLSVIGSQNGLYATALDYGITGYANASSGFGIYGYGFVGVYGSGSKYGVYGSGPNSGYAGFFSGPVYTTSTYQGSDLKLKENITAAPAALGIIGQLKPKQYTYRQDGAFKAMNLPTGTHYGLIAQDVEIILPELVKASSFEQPKSPPANGAGSDKKRSTPSEKIDFKAVNYVELIPILVKAVQELDLRNKQQDSVIEMLRQELAKVTGVNMTNGTGLLGQNIPNPAGSFTSVAYSVPSPSHQAYIAVMDNMGRLLQNIRVTGSGRARINITGLTAGVYHYSLICDNRVIDTKQLLIAR